MDKLAIGIRRATERLTAGDHDQRKGSLVDLSFTISA